jgi:hypothetical protein
MKSRIVVFLMFLSIKDFAQIDAARNYIIITFEKKVNKYPQHGVQRFYKIIETDSLVHEDFKFSYILMSGYSNDNFELCGKGMEIAPYLKTSMTNYDFDKNYLRGKDSLLFILEHRRRWLQTITKKWSIDLIEEIKIFATPVKGKFCKCIFRNDDDHDKYFNAPGYLPYSDFIYNEQSMTDVMLRHLQSFDFSNDQTNINPFQ